MGPKKKRKCVKVEENDFSKKSWKEDLALIVGGKKLYVSKAVLALESPVFCAMFEGDFAEKNEAEIELKEKTHEDFLEFLQCLYPGVRKPVTVDNVFTVLPLAEEYQVKTVKGECENCLLQELNTQQKSATFYCRTQRVSSLFNLPEVEEACIEHLSTMRMEEIEKCEKSHPLPVDSKIKLLTEMNMKLEEKIDEIEEDYRSERSLKDEEMSGLREKEKMLETFQSFFGQEKDHLIQGVITLDFNANQLSSKGKSVDKNFRGFIWRLTVQKNVVNGYEYLAVWATFNNGSQYVECKARITFTLKSRIRNKTSKIDDRNFGRQSSSRGYASWLSWEDFTSPARGFLQNNKATVEMFAMVHHPVPVY